MNRRYQLIKKLGAGGMGEVFLAYDRLQGKQVALKKVLFHQNTNLIDSLSLRESLAQEFALLASLRHPHIISVLDYGFDDDKNPYFTMELVEEPTGLLESLQGSSVEDAVPIMLEILQALNYLHRRNVSHRDLKPDNILIGESGVKILDFGLAQESQNEVTEGEEIAGTLAYIAPEVLSGNGFSTAADMYAVGLIAYEVLLGQHPYKDRPFAELIQSILGFVPDLSRVENPILSDALGRLLQSDPLDRLNALQAIEAFCLAVERQLPEETQVIRESYLTTARFVGRTEEIKLVLDSLQALDNQTGRFYLVAGENGSGKSRFLNEVAVLSLVRGALVLRGRATSEGASTLHLFRPVVRYLVLNVEVSNEEAAILQDIVPDIQALVALETLNDAPPMPPMQAKQRLINCIISLFKRLRQKTILILEDIHWASESYELLNKLSEEIQALPLLILASYRPEEKPDLEQSFSKVEKLPISKLSQEEIQGLSNAILGGKANTDIVHLLEAETNGNAFFIIELIRTLADAAGGLDKISKMTLPIELLDGGLQGLVENNLAALDSETYQWLLWAAVAGQELDLDLLKHILGQEAVEKLLLRAEETRILQVQEEKWQFTQDKVRRTLLSKLDAAELVRLHREVALAIEAIKTDLKAYAAKLAHHWQQAQNSLKERHYTRMAAEQALKIGIYVQAIPLLQRARALYTEEDSEDKVIIKEHLDVCLLYASAQLATKGQAATDVILAYNNARNLASKLDDAPEMGNIFFGMAAFFFTRGELKTAHALLEQTIQLADKYSDSAMRMQASMSMSNVLFWMGQFRKSLEYSAAVIRYYEASDMREFNVRYAQNPRITTMNSRVWSHWFLGDPVQAQQLAEETLALAETLAHPFNKAISLQILAFLHVFSGDQIKGNAVALDLVSFAQQHGFMIYTVLGEIFSAWAMAELDPEAGLPVLKTAIGRWQAISAKLGNSIFFALFAQISLRNKDFKAAADHLEMAFLHSQETNERLYLSELYRLRGELALAQGQTSDAHDTLEQALQIAQEQGALMLELKVRLSQYQATPSEKRKSEMASCFEKLATTDEDDLVIRAVQAILQ